MLGLTRFGDAPAGEPSYGWHMGLFGIAATTRQASGF